MNLSDTRATIACNLDALSAAERERRSDLARTIQRSATGLDESETGYCVRLPDDSETCRNALELVLLERRCCSFLTLELRFEAGDGALLLAVGGPPGVKDFLRENGVLGCARPAGTSTCC